MAKTKDFGKFLEDLVANDEELASRLDRERLNGEIAVLIYSKRTEAGLTQAQLADRAGTHQSAIARLEDGDYDGRTIEVLRTVLRALRLRLTISAEPLTDDTAMVNIIPFELKLWRPEPGQLKKETSVSESNG